MNVALGIARIITTMLAGLCIAGALYFIHDKDKSLFWFFMAQAWMFNYVGQVISHYF